MPTSTLHTSQQFEWSTSASWPLLTICFLLAVGWACWQLIRESRLTGNRASLWFIPLRLIVAGTLFWMILGPTSVLVQREIRPRVVSVFLDTSSSMQTTDQPDPLADRRWNSAATATTDPLIAADRVALFAGAMRQQAAELIRRIDQRASPSERTEAIEHWSSAATECAKWLFSLSSEGSASGKFSDLVVDLQRVLTTELQPLFASTDWVLGTDPGDREERLSRLTDTGSQFAVQCRNLWQSQWETSSDAHRSLSSSVSHSTRASRVIPILEQSLALWRNQAADKYQIQLSQFSEEVSNLPADDWASFLRSRSEAEASNIQSTDLTKVLIHIQDECLRSDTAAAVILTDGRQTVHAASDLRDLASQCPVPLYFVPIGRGEMQRDVILHHVHAPPSVIQNDQILIDGILSAYDYSGATCEVQLLENGSVLQSQQISFTKNHEDQRFHFDIDTTETGRREFSVRASLLPEEFSSENNAETLAVEVADATLRVLIADARARWESQYLVNLFRRQERLEFDQLRFAPQLTATGQRASTHAFPETVDEWSYYRLVVLGDVGPRQLDRKSQEALAEYVIRRGGCVIVIAGQNFMPQAFSGEPLEELLPVNRASDFRLANRGYRIELTAEGKSSDVMRLSDNLAATESIWQNVNDSLPLYFMSNYHLPKPTSQTWLNAVPIEGSSRGEQSPTFFCWHQVGAGRVAYLSAPATYHLRMLNGDTFHHRFWGQVIRWIVTRSALPGSKFVKLQADRSHYIVGDNAQLTVELSDLNGIAVPTAAPELVVRQGESVQDTLPMQADAEVPGRFRAKYLSETPGKYSIEVRGPDVERLLASENYNSPVSLDVTFEPGLNQELLDLRSDRPLLEQLAEQTGGLVLEPTALAELDKIFSVEPQSKESRQQTPLWDRWWCLWAILGCLSTEWLIRKSLNLA